MKIADNVGGLGGVSILYSTPDHFPELIESEKLTAKGLIRTQTSGIRPVFRHGNCSLGEGEHMALLKLLGNGASLYYYFPDEIPGGYLPEDFPMPVKVRIAGKRGQAWDGDQIVWYVDLEIRGVYPR